ARVAFEDEFGADEEREVSCEAQSRVGRSRVKNEAFLEVRRNLMGNEPSWALPEGSGHFCSDEGNKG
ncbi:hypothetical protein Tco_1281843, partial [Tanacetum coccineum]